MSNQPNYRASRKKPGQSRLPSVLVKGWGRMPFLLAAAQFSQCDCGFDLWFTVGDPESLVLQNNHEPGCPVLSGLS